MSDEHKKRRVYFFILAALLAALIAYSTALEVAETENVFEIVVNNTNLAPAEVGHPGTGERLTGVNYTASLYPLQLLVFSHADTAGQISEIHIFVNGSKILDISGKPLGAAEENNKSLTAIIPKDSIYMVEFSNTHHYEWREYPILSGRNGTLSINQTSAGINQTQLDAKVNKSGDNMTGILNMFSNGDYAKLNLFSQKQNLYSEGLGVFKKGNTTDINGTMEINEELGYHNFYGWNGGNYTRGAYALAKANSNWNNTNHGTKYIISTRNPFDVEVNALELDPASGIYTQIMGSITSSQSAVCINPATGLIQNNWGATSCLVSSIKYKTNISYINIPANSTLMKLKPVTYNDIGDNTKRVGFIAEDIYKDIPNYKNYLIYYELNNSSDPRGLNYEGLLTLAIKTIQEQQQIINKICSNNQTICK